MLSGYSNYHVKIKYNAECNTLLIMPQIFKFRFGMKHYVLV